MTQQTDFRVLCAELLSRLEESDDYILKEEGTIALADRARAALAQPSDVGLLELMPQQFREDLATVSRMAAHGAGTGVTPGLFRVSLNTGALDYARAVLARYGHQPAPVPVAEFDCPACEDVPIDTIRAALKRLQELENKADLSPAPAPAEGEVAGPTRDDLWELWLRLNNELPDRPAAVAEFWEHAQIDARARWGRPAPAPAGKAAEVMGLFRRWADAYPDGVMVDPYWLTRAADLLEQFSSGWVVPTVEQFAPVPVAERLPDASDPRECRMPDGSCWWFDPHEDGAWYFDAYQGNYTHWLPATALPLPSGEVE